MIVMTAPKGMAKSPRTVARDEAGGAVSVSRMIRLGDVTVPARSPDARTNADVSPVVKDVIRHEHGSSGSTNTDDVPNDGGSIRLVKLLSPSNWPKPLANWALARAPLNGITSV